MITETEHFIIEHPENDKSIKDVGKALEKGYERMSKALDYEIKEKTGVIIFKSLDEYSKWFDNYEFASWNIGGHHNDNGKHRICFVSPSVWSFEYNNHEYKEIWSAAPHEVCHLFSSIVNMHDGNQALSFLEEGICCYFGRNFEGFDNYVREVKENYKPLSTVVHDSTKSDLDSRLSYVESYVMIEWLVKNHGEEKIALFMKHNGSFDEKFENAFGLKYKDAETQFEKWLKN